MSIRQKLSHSQFFRRLLQWQPADEYRLFLSERDLFLAEAKERFASEQPSHGSFQDYKRAFHRHRVTYSEYMYSYEYWKLSEPERDEFLSTSEAQCIYRKAGDSEVRRIFKDKSLFLNTFKPFVHRRWSLVADMGYEAFMDMVKASDCLLKPLDGTRGEGIEKIHYREDGDYHNLFERCRQGKFLIEASVEACPEISEFHPQSLNTIRVVTISHNERCVLFGALFRMGSGDSFVDNTHAGGIYAPIDTETGIVLTDGIDAHNRRYVTHPDTGKAIKGFVIPQWPEIVETCQRLTRHIPNIRFAGWDLCVRPGGVIEVIEGNHAPDFDGGMQAPMKTGVKYRFQKVVKEVAGFDPLPLISIFRTTKKQR